MNIKFEHLPIVVLKHIISFLTLKDYTNLCLAFPDIYLWIKKTLVFNNTEIELSDIQHKFIDLKAIELQECYIKYNKYIMVPQVHILNCDFDYQPGMFKYITELVLTTDLIFYFRRQHYPNLKVFCLETSNEYVRFEEEFFQHLEKLKLISTTEIITPLKFPKCMQYLTSLDIINYQCETFNSHCPQLTDIYLSTEHDQLKMDLSTSTKLKRIYSFGFQLILPQHLILEYLHTNNTINELTLQACKHIINPNNYNILDTTSVQTISHFHSYIDLNIFPNLTEIELHCIQDFNLNHVEKVILCVDRPVNRSVDLISKNNIFIIENNNNNVSDIRLYGNNTTIIIGSIKYVSFIYPENIKKLMLLDYRGELNFNLCTNIEYLSIYTLDEPIFYLPCLKELVVYNLKTNEIIIDNDEEFSLTCISNVIGYAKIPGVKTLKLFTKKSQNLIINNPNKVETLYYNSDISYLHQFTNVQQLHIDSVDINDVLLFPHLKYLYLNTFKNEFCTIETNSTVLTIDHICSLCTHHCITVNGKFLNKLIMPKCFKTDILFIKTKASTFTLEHLCDSLCDHKNFILNGSASIKIENATFKEIKTIVNFIDNF